MLGYISKLNHPLVGEYAFPLTGFVCMAAHVTFGGISGIITYPSMSDSHVPFTCVNPCSDFIETHRKTVL